MTDAEKREAARQFYNKWVGKGKEDEDDRSFWLDILQRLMGADDATDRIEFQKKVIVDGNTKRIDAYIPETKVIIEQKTLGIDLDKKGHQSGGILLTPYEQAKRYNDNLPSSEKARWIVTSNFAEIWVYDMDTKVPEQNVTKLAIKDLQTLYSKLDFLLSKKVKKITQEMELSLKAGELVGKIHDRFLEQYNDPMAKRTQNSLNILCVRLVFCLYAEDAGLFGEKDAFRKYIEMFQPGQIRRALLDLFEVLNTPLDERADMYLDDTLAKFPYCNGGLFAREHIEIPKITQEIKDTLLESAMFNWSEISPTIFGAVFESTLNPETRRSGGMHYTSIENIHKVIDPLFLDDLKAEFEEIKKIAVERTKKRKLEEFQNKLASLKFFDPACGSGNFLTETYVSIRRLENQVISEINHGQIMFGMDTANPIKVSIHQFYGIEINDFAVTVAKTALWIAESQMMKETEDIVLMHLDFLPLKTNATIIEGNALQLDWHKIVSKQELSYMIGNPPFVGHQMRTDAQAKDMELAFYDLKKHGKLDYVCAWYNKAADYIKDTDITVAFVSTNSICQGESVALLWDFLTKKKKVEIQFAYQTFIWDSEANLKAHVHCVIVGFSCKPNSKKKKLFSNESMQLVDHINGYLVAAPDVYVQSRGACLTPGLPEMHKGSQATDGLGLILEPEAYAEFTSKYPSDLHLVKPYMGSYEFINRKDRYCLWLNNVAPSEYKKNAFIMQRLQMVADFRKTSATASVRDYADNPSVFTQIRQPSEDYLAFPAMSSSRRRYMPIGYLSSEVIASNQLYILPRANMYMFGVLTSNVHMAWMRVVCGRLKSDYRYAPAIYNNFPWPNPTEEQKAKIEQTAKHILEARDLFPTSTLADLYDPLTMPPELRKAHQLNDKAVMQAYGFDIKNTSEADCVAHLMKLYQELTSK